MAVRLLFLSATAVLLGCSSEPPDVKVHDALSRLASGSAIDCGRATTTSENIQQSACALEASEQRKPFFVQYRARGVDAISEEGIAQDANGALFGVGAFSWGRAASPLGKVYIHKCQGNSLRKIDDERLICS